MGGLVTRYRCTPCTVLKLTQLVAVADHVVLHDLVEEKGQDRRREARWRLQVVQLGDRWEAPSTASRALVRMRCRARETRSIALKSLIAIADLPQALGPGSSQLACMQ
jgi:hypothetical protein